MSNLLKIILFPENPGMYLSLKSGGDINYLDVSIVFVLQAEKPKNIFLKKSLNEVLIFSCFYLK
jgi:hypothetical protein